MQRLQSCFYCYIVRLCVLWPLLSSTKAKHLTSEDVIARLIPALCRFCGLPRCNIFHLLLNRCGAIATRSACCISNQGYFDQERPGPGLTLAVIAPAPSFFPSRRCIRYRGWCLEGPPDVDEGAERTGRGAEGDSTASRKMSCYMDEMEQWLPFRRIQCISITEEGVRELVRTIIYFLDMSDTSTIFRSAVAKTTE